jgi:hypothetical protein
MYIYREGVLRTAAKSYSLEDLEDSFAHLSNHCIAEKHPDFGKFEPTNEMWFSDFDLYLRQKSSSSSSSSSGTGSNTLSDTGFYSHIWPQICDITAHMLQVSTQLNHLHLAPNNSTPLLSPYSYTAHSLTL